MAYGVICTDKGNMKFEMGCEIKDIKLYQLNGLLKQVHYNAKLLSIHEVSKEQFETLGNK